MGRAKTRLAATIGNEAALEVYKRLLQRTFKVTADLPVDKVVFYDQFVDRNDFWPNEIYEKEVQCEGELGDKMLSAFNYVFERGYKRAAIIGSDCYDLSPEFIQDAFEQLKEKDAVIGPSHDGGYYLLGLSKPCEDIFKNKRWSTSSVCLDTEKDLEALKFKYAKLQALSDVDTEEDLGPWAEDLVKTKF